MSTLKLDEKHQSQIPAMQLLANLDYKILPPGQADAERGGKARNVLLENILRRQLQKINRIEHLGEEYLFSDSNIQDAIQELKGIRHQGLLQTNEAVYNRLAYGIALEQTVGDARKSHTLQYIDWKNPHNNVFHAAFEFSVERSKSSDTIRPDIVLFVNGIPLGVIECKAPDEKVEQAVSQQIRNQGSEYAPHLFAYTQLLMGVNRNTAKYATAGTKAEFWSVWDEREDRDEQVSQAVNTPLPDEQKDSLFSDDFARDRTYFENFEREITVQDRAIHSLCRPERLLELAYHFTLFDNGQKKIARYQQFFVVRSIMQRIRERQSDDTRKGGMVFQAQGSGKSLTMVMLVHALSLADDISNAQLVLVTDRKDLDSQLGKTFSHCGLEVQRADSGRHLIALLRDGTSIVTTLIHKFARGWGAEKYSSDSSDIFVLVDESHRTNFGSLAARMRQILPNGCYIGFTGTPLMKEEKNNFRKFGGLIEPQYSIKQAVKDKAVVPLLYESRHAEMKQDEEAINLWFERHTAGLSDNEKADLKHKYSRAPMLDKADRVVYMRAFDISLNYAENWQGKGFKAQLVAPDKITALKYHDYLKDLNQVSSEVIISAPDSRDGHEEVGEGSTEEVNRFWDKMMQQYGSEDNYNRSIRGQFEEDEHPEILIVVDKLLTGFDVPCNTTLYLCRRLTEHTLLQAIARVNRLYEDKDYGYIVDYVNILKELDQALTMYGALKGYDESDLDGALISVHTIVNGLDQKHSNLLDIFSEVKDDRDIEAKERLLEKDDLRNKFYQALSEFRKTLEIAVSTERFLREIDEQKLQMYARTLGEYRKLKRSVELRYADAVDYRKHEPKIKALLDKYVQSNRVIEVTENSINIFDDEAVSQVLEGHATYGENRSDAAKADAIAHETRRTINDNMDKNPAFYEKFSKLIQATIDDYWEQRLSALEYLNKVEGIRKKVVTESSDDLPERIANDTEAGAYYRAISEYLAEPEAEDSVAIEEDILIDMALELKKRITDGKVVDFWKNSGAVNDVKKRFIDYFYDNLQEQHSIELSDKQMNTITNTVLSIARSRDERNG